MGSRRSNMKIISNNQSSLDALAKQNEMQMKLAEQQSAQQRQLFQQQMKAMQEMSQGLLSGNRSALDAQAVGARNQEILNRAQGQNQYANTLEQESLARRQQRIQEMANNDAMNQADRAKAQASNNQANVISQFIRRRRMMGY